MSEIFIVNQERKRFELKVRDDIAFIEFTLSEENVIFLTHTKVPVEIEGKGYGSKIVALTLEYIKKHNYKLAPLCSFVAKYITKHPEWKSLIAEGYHLKK